MNDAADPSDYRVAVAADLKWMRERAAKLTQREMALRLGHELGRRVPDSSISRWEKGTKLAGGDVYRAYMAIAGIALPRDTTAEAQGLSSGLVAEILARLGAIERRQLPGELPGTNIALEDLATVMVAAKKKGRSRQTLHNWMQKNEIRWTKTRGRRILVSLSDVMAHE